MSNKNFYQKHTLFTMEKVNEVHSLAKRPDQPEFIKMKMVNKQPVAFLGGADLTDEDIYGKRIRVDKMVIPEFSRMINSDYLLKYLSKKSLQKDQSAINLKSEKFFHPGQANESILLNVCGKIEKSAFKDLHFHHCDNHVPEYRAKAFNSGPITLDNSGNGFETCPPMNLYPEKKNGKLVQRLPLLYISKEGIQKSDDKIKCLPTHPGTAHPGNFSIEQMLTMYFDSTPFESDNHLTINWGSLAGVFLIPMLFADQRIVYYCLLNVDGLSNINRSIRYTLKTWLSAVVQSNKKGMEAVIAGNDGDYFFMEEWSIFISKNNKVKVLKENKIYKEKVLKNKIS